MKRTFAQYKKEVHSVMKENKAVMLINHWNINIFFHKELSERGDDVVGHCETSIKYYNADINFYPIHFTCYKEKDDYTFIKTIIHEMSHIITDPLYLEAYLAVPPISRDYLETIREQTTERIANIIYNLHN